MSKATLPYSNRLAMVFDFDETLAPDTFSALLKHCDIEQERFTKERVDPLAHAGWDTTLARFYGLIEEARSRDDLSITRDTFREVGEQLELYRDVEKMFGRVREFAQAVLPEIEVEFYLLTAGMLEIPRATPIAEEFRVMWGGELHFDEAGDLAFVKRTVSYPDKIRYVLKLCKGLDIDAAKITEDVYRHVPEDDWHLPLSQLIYVGDGDSDMPVFAYLKEHAGLAIGVHQSASADEWEGHEEMHAGRRVQNLAASDYSDDSELMRSLQYAVESITKQMKLRQLSYKK